MDLTIEQHTYGITRIIIVLLLLIGSSYMFLVFYKKRRLPAFYVGMTLLLAAFIFLYTVIEYFSFLLGYIPDISLIVFIFAILGSGSAIPWCVILGKIDKRWNIAFYITLILFIIGLINITFFNQLLIFRNELGYLTHVYAFPTSIIGVGFLIASLVVSGGMIKLAFKDRTSPSGLFLLMIGMAGILHTLTRMIWILNIINDIGASIMAGIYTTIIILGEHQPAFLLNIWLLKK
ncbi:MAG: hypothetical protein QXL15_02540 [Candidatus Korarchaeota archaeon]